MHHNPPTIMNTITSSASKAINHHSLTPLAAIRTLTTTAPLHRNPAYVPRPGTIKHYAPSTHKQLDKQHANIPEYPFGRARWYKQANFGLYGGLARRVGNQVSEQNEIKTRRAWKPNVRSKQLWSTALQCFVRVKVVARVQRTIEKVGGLDEYLLGHKTARIRELGMAGWALRWRVMRTESVRERLRGEREALGLTEPAPWEELPAVLVEGGGFRSKWDAGRAKEEAEAAKRIETVIDDALDVEEQAALRGEDAGLDLGLSR